MSSRSLASVALVLLAFACGAPTANGAQTAPRKPAQVMSFTGASWLERESRVVENKPGLVIAAMGLSPGLTVADVGAGTGYYTRRLARAVLPGGKVYAEDIQPEMLKLLKKYAAEEGLDNIETVLAWQGVRECGYYFSRLKRRPTKRLLLTAAAARWMKATSCEDETLDSYALSAPKGHAAVAWEVAGDRERVVRSTVSVEQLSLSLCHSAREA